MRRRLTAIAIAVGLLAGCSSATNDDPEEDGVQATTPPVDDPTTSAVTAGGDEPCAQGATVDRVDAAPVAGSDSDLDVTMPDGTVIRAHWFPTPAADDPPAPTVLMGPGWSLPGDTSADGAPIFGALGIGVLNERGYNVLTWDPRGFGESTGTVTVNDPENEGRDVRVLLDWVAEQPEAQTDGAGDPRVGMVGVSYGGGIQLTVAGTDCRVDALVPNVAWHSLETSLYGHETVKAGWSGALVGAAAGGDLDPHITSAAASGLSDGTLSDEDRQWFADRGPGDLVDAIRAPTLLVHGTVDTLFTLQEAVTNLGILQGNGVPAAMLWYCGGHGTCLTDPGDDALVGTRTFAWLDRYVMGDEEVDTGPVVDVLDQDGDRWTGDAYPSETDGSVTASGPGGRLALGTASAAGPLAPGSSADVLAGLVSPITPARAAEALELTVIADDDALVVGAPHLTLTYSGTTPDGPEPTRAFAQLVDEDGGVVLGNQITPLPLVLDGEEHTLEIDLEVVAQHLTAGDRITVQIVATTPAYATPRLGGELTVTAVTVALPTTTTLRDLRG